MKKNNKKKRRDLLYKQEKYEKLRKEAYKELKILEDYFGRRKTKRKDILWEVLVHLEAHQKELSYNGHRGVMIGIVSSILVYVFNTGIISELIDYEVVGNWIVKIIVMTSVSTIVGAFFMIIYTIGTSHFFNDDKRIRNQIYINEFMLKVVKKEYDDLI